MKRQETITLPGRRCEKTAQVLACVNEAVRRGFTVKEIHVATSDIVIAVKDVFDRSLMAVVPRSE